MVQVAARAAVVGALLWMLITAAGISAEAQAECLIDEALPGSVPYLLAGEARETNARTYGVIGTLESRILSELMELESDEYGTVFYLGGDSLYGVTEVPVTLRGSCSGIGSAPLDLNAYNLGFAGRFNILTLYYAGGAHSGILAESSDARAGATVFNYMLGHVYNVAAPAFGSRKIDYSEDGVSSFRVDYIAGFGLDLSLVDISAGYVGSRGAFFTIDQSELRLFARTLIKDARDTYSLDYLKAGKRAFDWWNEGGAQGETTAYARKLKLPVPTAEDLRDELYERTLEQINLWTAHIEQRDILKYFDLTGAYEIQPEPKVHEFKLAFHTPNYNQALGVSDIRKRRDELWPIEAAGYVGMVQFPRMSFYEVEGGGHFATGLDVMVPLGERGATFEHALLRFQIWRNDPSTLSLFPYAIDAWQAHLSLQMMTVD